MKKIYIVAALHGDELFGLKIIAHVRALGRADIVTYVAHPEAIAKKRRFLDTDLNRSFAPDAEQSREADIAKQITADIIRCNPDVILDLHTSHGDVGKVAILANDNPVLLDMSKHLLMEQAVVMPKDIARASLIGQFPDKGISIEFGRHNRSDALAKAIATRIASLDTALDAPTDMPTYYVTRIIGNAEAPGEELHNYQFNKTLGGYPFLVGKNTYKTMRGFLAEKRS